MEASRLGCLGSFLSTHLSVAVPSGNVIRHVLRLYVLGIIFLVLHVSASLSSALTIVSPNGGEIFPSGATCDIRWEDTEGAATIRLMYSIDNGASWQLIVNGIAGASYSWPVPVQRKNRNKCLVKIIGFNAAGKKINSDISDEKFSIEVVKLLSPNGGEVLMSGDTTLLAWQAYKTVADVAKILFYYSLDNGATWKRRGETVPVQDNALVWKVPGINGVTFKARVKVVLKDVTGRNLGSDVSDSRLTITDGRRHIYDNGDWAFSVSYIDPYEKVTTGAVASMGGTAYGENYTYAQCPDSRPVRGFSLQGKNRTSGIAGYVYHAYSSYCDWLFCACRSRWVADFSLVLGNNVLVLNGQNAAGNYTKVLDTIRRIPLTPSNVAVIPGDGQNTLVWDPSPDATSYHIYWAETSPVSRTADNQLRAAASPFTHTGLVNGTAYYYVIAAYAAQVESDLSAAVVGVPGQSMTIVDAVSGIADRPARPAVMDVPGKVHDGH